MEPITGFAEVNGARLYYKTMGEGVAVLFAHAGIADSRMWDDQFAVFAEKYRVIRFDHRGFGQSRAPKMPFSLHADMRGLLQHLGVDRAVLIGCSMSGAAVIDFALEYPEMTLAVVPVCGGVGGSDFEGAPPPLWPEYEAAEKARNYPLAAEYAVRIWVDGRKRSPDKVDKGIRDKVRDMVLKSYEAPLDTSQYQEIDPPAATRLDALTAPVLAVIGDLDEPSVKYDMDMLAAHAPNARKVILTGTAHLPNMERPEDFNAAVLGWLEGVLG